MSIFNKKWKLLKSAPADFLGLFPEFSVITKQLLWNRGVSDTEQIDRFFNSDYDEHLHNPYLLKDIKKAARRILKAVNQGENILIYGDYDADGVCASTLLKNVFEMLGAKNIEVYIPDRNDKGYGVNREAVESFIKKGVNLIVTVDCGSTNVKEIEFAQKHGVDVVVTDHHQVTDRHDFAYALVNPQREDDEYPFKGLSGTAVAFKLAQVLIEEARKEELPAVINFSEGWEKWLLDLVAISTVTDVMPLQDENRVLLKYGFLVLKKTRRLGLRELIKKARVDINNMDAFTIGFILGPRLNAAGRMEHANLAFNLLNAIDINEASRLTDELEKLNNERREVVAKILDDLEKKDLEKKYAIFEGHEDWPIGVLGIAAGRLVDKYNKPTFLYQRKQQTLVGSARTPQNFNTVTILASSSLYLEKFGGHAQAGGFTALLDNEENLQDMILKITEQYVDKIGKDNVVPTVNIDAELQYQSINWDLYDELAKFKPFGEKNPSPVFLLKNVFVLRPQMVGQKNNHFRCFIKDDLNSVSSKKAIGFNFPTACASIKEEDKLDIVFSIDLDEWNGNRELNLKLIDIKINS